MPAKEWSKGLDFKSSPADQTPVRCTCSAGNEGRSASGERGGNGANGGGLGWQVPATVVAPSDHGIKVSFRDPFPAVSLRSLRFSLTHSLLLSLSLSPSPFLWRSLTHFLTHTVGGASDHGASGRLERGCPPSLELRCLAQPFVPDWVAYAWSRCGQTQG